MGRPGEQELDADSGGRFQKRGPLSRKSRKGALSLELQGQAGGLLRTTHEHTSSSDHLGR